MLYRICDRCPLRGVSGYTRQVGTRARIALRLAAAGWLAAIVAVGVTSPGNGGDGPSPAGAWYHTYAIAAIFVAGMAAIPGAFWLVDRRERRPGLGRQAVVLLVGAVVALSIGAVGVRVSVHPPYGKRCAIDHGRETCTNHPRPEGELVRYGLAALGVVALTLTAVGRVVPRPPVPEPPSPPRAA